MAAGVATRGYRRSDRLASDRLFQTDPLPILASSLTSRYGVAVADGVPGFFGTDPTETPCPRSRNVGNSGGSLVRRCLGCGTLTENTRCGACGQKRSSTERGYGADWRRLVVDVLNRDGHRCHWCGGPATSGDHVVPLAHGGSRLDPGNVVAACVSCNSSRGARVRK